MNQLNVIYMGSPSFSASVLRDIIADKDLPISIVHVVTREDKPVGRTKEMSPTAVKVAAQELNIPVSHELTTQDIERLNADLVLVFAYGKIIPTELLRAPKYGFWNIHPSLLPYYRGASPITFPLLMGEEKTGCSLMVMDEKLDHGPVINQEEISIEKTDTHIELLERLSTIGTQLFKKHIVQLHNGELDLSSLPVQNDMLATFTKMLKKDDGFIEKAFIDKALAHERVVTEEFPTLLRDFISQNTMMQFPIPYAPYILYNTFRALTPWPGIWTNVSIQNAEKRLKILECELSDQNLVIKTVQLEGKNPVSFEQFNTAYNVFSTMKS